MLPLTLQFIVATIAYEVEAIEHLGEHRMRDALRGLRMDVVLGAFDDNSLLRCL
jgi:hypothetical protein